MGGGVRGSLVRSRRLLIDAILGEDVVQVRTLRRVVDDLEWLFHLAAYQNRLRTTGV